MPVEFDQALLIEKIEQGPAKFYVGLPEADVLGNPKNHENERFFNKHKRMISNTMSTMKARLNAKKMSMMEKLDELLKIIA